MSRKIVVGGAQMGPIHSSSTRSEVIDRMLVLMQAAHARGVKLLLYPELAFTTFFPRHLYKNPQELESFFERGNPTDAPGMKPLFEKAREYGMDISVGFAECDTGDHKADDEHLHYNTAVYYSASSNKVIAKYRKVHLPGTFEPFKNPDATNQFEKRYFRPGNLGFEAFRAPNLVKGALKKSTAPAEAANGPAGEEHTADKLGHGDPLLGILICNDRRWPEAWRCYGLQGVEILLCGYNTTAWAPDLLGTHPSLTNKTEAKSEALFHSSLCAQAGSYQNACFSINVAKGGIESQPEAAHGGNKDGMFELIAGSNIVDPDGKVIVEAKTDDDELIVAEIDLEMCRRGKGKVFAFERHRRTEHYQRIVAQTGVEEPPLLG